MIERGEDLSRRLSAHGDALDAEIKRSGALSRIRRNVLPRGPADLFAGLTWQRVAAAILIAGALGGAVDLALPESNAEPFDVAAVAPLYAFDGADSE
jgi:hypothetical protein